jgi:uncharacterized membrane-anchored protein YitT (DUF2179 family)
MSKFKIVGEIVGILLGSLVYAFSLNTLLIPSHLLAGGVTGICMIIFHFTGWSVGTLYFLFNIPLLVIGYIHMGRKFILYTLVAVGAESLFLNWVPIRNMWTDNIMLSSIFGAVIGGIGTGLMLRVGGSGGGLDVPARVIAKYRNISIAKFSLAINLIIVTVSAVIFDVQSAMYTILSLYAGTKTLEMMLNHAEKSSVTIITDKGNEISRALNETLHRGVTTWEAEGAFTHSEKKALYCVIINVQWPELCHTVLQIDPKAFITAAPAHKIIGNFKAW